MMFHVIIATVVLSLILPTVPSTDTPSIASLGSYAETIQECDNLNRTTYLRSEGMRIQEIPRSSIRAVSLNQCAKHCSMKTGAVDCHSFEYNAAAQTCSLQSSQGQPFGPSIVVNTNDPGVAFFQKICIASEELCAAPYAFERFPQHVLMGQALQVLSTDGLSECLALCLEAKRKFKIDCRSLMYYYETGECILNRETRKEFPESFTNDTKFHLVDYFENNCYDIACFGDAEIHWIRSEDFNIGIDKDVIMNGLTAEECKQACVENMVGAEMFPCKAFVYSSSKQECHLTAESGLIKHSLSLISGDTDAETTKNKLNAELSAISAGHYYEKYCVEGPVKCKDASFELISGKMLESYDKIIQTMSVAHCLHLCLSEVENCTSAMFFKDKNECVLNKKSQFSDPDLFKSDQNVDYYDNICDYEPGTLASLEKVAPAKNAFAMDDETFLSTGGSIDQALVNFREESLESSAEKRQKPVFQAAPAEKVKGTLETECRLDGIVITAHFEQPTSGALFIKDHSSTCRQIFTNSIQSQLEIPFPSSVDSNPDCPGIELAPNLWSFIVVIQKNNIGIPSLMTESDRVFNVTCDYSNTAVTSVQKDANKESEVFVTLKTTEEFIGKIRMSILRNSEPVTTVSLGEELELKWNIDSVKESDDKSQKFGYFIDECIAERLDGQPPDPAPLRLIYQGCPDEKVRNRLMRYPIVEVSDGFSTKMKAFRFDGSRRVRIRCAVNICVDECKPVTCESDRDFNSVLSYGKKRKKRQTVADLQNLLKKYHDAKINGNIQVGEEPEDDDSSTVMEHSTISGTYTIIENDKEALEAKGTNDSKVSLPLDLAKASLPVIPSIINNLEVENATEKSGMLDCDSLFSFDELSTLAFSFYKTKRKPSLRCQGPNSFYDENISLSSTASLTHSGSGDFYTTYFNQMKDSNVSQSKSIPSDGSKSNRNSSEKHQSVLSHSSLSQRHIEHTVQEPRMSSNRQSAAVAVARYRI
uniref:Uncharacterized protein n=1 Tax=Panagrolaimus sp. JU765 TaxID=591449 RepID=A0AC34RIN7_9BILA